MIRQINEYITVSQSDSEAFDLEIDELLGKGYQPYGLPFMAVEVAATSENMAQYRFMQVMVECDTETIKI